jgi:hypothetical protein
MIMLKLSFGAILGACLLAAPGIAQSQQPAGHALWVYGQVERVAADGSAKPLAKGDAVFEGDVIRSGAGSHAQFVMKDEALVAVRADSSLKLAKYAYAGREDGTERAIIELLKGGMRSVTGAIGRSNKENYQLKNEMNVIGIRGTDHETFATDAGVFNRVTLGGTYIENAGGRIDLAPGEVGFAGRAAGSSPLRLERTPAFMHVAALTRADTGPRPRTASASDEKRLDKQALSVGPAKPSAPRGQAQVATGGGGTAPGVSTTAPSLSAAAPGLSAGTPAAALPGAGGQGFGIGGRCDGPCADPLNTLKNNGKPAKLK